MTDEELSERCERIMLAANKNLDATSIQQLEVQPRSVKTTVAIVLATLQDIANNPVKLT